MSNNCAESIKNFGNTISVCKSPEYFEIVAKDQYKNIDNDLKNEIDHIDEEAKKIDHRIELFKKLKENVQSFYHGISCDVTKFMKACDDIVLISKELSQDSKNLYSQTTK